MTSTVTVACNDERHESCGGITVDTRATCVCGCHELRRSIDLVLGMVRREILSSCDKHGRFASMHEGYAVLTDQTDELWAAVRGRDDVAAMRAAVQSAAMAALLAVDVVSTPPSGERK